MVRRVKTTPTGRGSERRSRSLSARAAVPESGRPTRAMPSVYVSSTYDDLIEYRKAVARALRMVRATVVAMEDYVSRDERPLDACRKDIEACDVYVGIVAWRYGFVPTHNNPRRLSITELEYEHAQDLRKPCLMFLLDPSMPWPPDVIDAITRHGRGGQSVRRFRRQLEVAHVVSRFKSADELAMMVHVAVYQQHEQAQSMLAVNNMRA